MKDQYYDNTRIQEFRSCPRKFFFRHVKDWTTGGFSPPLVFGSSWHAAMDAVWDILPSNRAPNSGTLEVMEAAKEAFMTCWTENNGPDVWEMSPEELKSLEPRTPFIAFEMLHEYIIAREQFFKKIEIISIEQPFAVPLDPNNKELFYVGRLDKVFRMGKDILVGEHKTTSLYKKFGPFRHTFIDSFSPNSQVDGYTHALHMLYGKEAKGVWIDGALVHRTVHDGFMFIPIERQFSQLDAWLWETQYWIDQIKQNWNAVQEGLFEDTEYMSAFPKNTSTCQDYNRNCSYMDLCKAWSNPSMKDLPAGFVDEPWSPFDRLELEKIGMEKKEKDNA